MVIFEDGRALDLRQVFDVVRSSPTEDTFSVNGEIIRDEQVLKFRRVVFFRDSILTLRNVTAPFIVLAADELTIEATVESPATIRRIAGRDEQLLISSLAGPPGRNGNPGPHGEGETDRKGHDGGNGEDGGPGFPGRTQELPAFVLIATRVRFGGATPPDQLTLRVSFEGIRGGNGGRGGDGGRGGNGADGKAGADGFFTCRESGGNGGNGGFGGRGGRGGDAGRGGNGGNVVFVTRQAGVDPLRFVAVKLEGGQPGQPGPSGASAPGGRGGQGGKGTRFCGGGVAGTHRDGVLLEAAGPGNPAGNGAPGSFRIVNDPAFDPGGLF